MKIEDWTYEQIETLISRYREKGLQEGGMFTLAELLLESKRRTPSKFSGHEVVNAIIELAHNSTTRFVTYGDIYSFLSKGLSWKGNATQREMSLALERGIAYCVDNQLPILTVLVVKQTGNHSPEAIQRIYEEAKEMGMEVGLDPAAFVNDQVQRCRNFLARK